MNYITALPDFVEMQRVSFCWFIAQGLNEELTLFSQIHDFSYNTEYRLFGQEYSLVKPVYTIVRAKKLAANYSAQLVIPLEVRNKKLNSVRYFGQFTIINLPLMTTTATFVINGCERVIVSQIIRSPGIYFDKNKNQRKRKPFKSKVLGHTSKLGAFLPSGLPWLIPDDQAWKPWIIGNKQKQDDQKTFKTEFSLYSLKAFKIYRIISITSNQQLKLKRIKLFLQWLKINWQALDLQHSLNKLEVPLVLNYWNLLLKFLIKYQLLQDKLSNESVTPQNHWIDKLVSSWNLTNDSNYKVNNNRLIYIYRKKLQYYQNVIQTQFFDNLISIPFSQQEKKFLNLENFSPKQEKKRVPEININEKKVKFAFYFSTSLKEIFKYRSTKKTKALKIRRSTLYLKSPSKIVQFKDDHPITDFYKEKYDAKDFYTATLIPE